MNEEEMKEYYEKIKKEDEVDLDWLIALKRIKLDDKRNFFNLVLVIYISGFALVLPNFLFVDIEFKSIIGMIYFVVWYIFILSCAVISYRVYKKDVGKVLAKLEVLKYIKKQQLSK
ncbi:hypothetical protein [Enterococcus mundtii]|uniref:hypothetical protein n=1 Tax=Enterococcus mundtii TaxID=53346 RepID=UPI001CF59E44|nr:hypothetical protein [Enterococcus mundtii]MCA6775356.1 hypothetical protein [Enterococcus mundtii]